jgi:hypothetical protein
MTASEVDECGEKGPRQADDPSGTLRGSCRPSEMLSPVGGPEERSAPPECPSRLGNARPRMSLSERAHRLRLVWTRLSRQFQNVAEADGGGLRKMSASTPETRPSCVVLTRGRNHSR